MYEVRIELTFDAGHRLLDYPGKCETPHGHTFKVEITLISEKLDNMGFVADFIELKSFTRKWVETHWDHAFLMSGRDTELISAFNSLSDKKIFIFENENPTVEVMAKHLYDQCRTKYGDMISRVRVWESPTQYADYFQR